MIFEQHDNGNKIVMNPIIHLTILLLGILWISITTPLHSRENPVTIYVPVLIQSSVNGVNNYSDDRKSGRNPRLKLAAVRCLMLCMSLFFSWNMASGVASCQGGWETEGLGCGRAHRRCSSERQYQSVSPYRVRTAVVVEGNLAALSHLIDCYSRISVESARVAGNECYILFTTLVHLWLRKYLTWCERPLLGTSIVECCSDLLFWYYVTRA